MDIKEKIKEIFSDKEFADKAFKMTADELSEALKEKDIQVSVEEIEEAAKILNSMANNNGELDVTALDNISGGGKAGDFAAGVLWGVVVAGGAFLGIW